MIGVAGVVLEVGARGLQMNLWPASSWVVRYVSVGIHVLVTLPLCAGDPLLLLHDQFLLSLLLDEELISGHLDALWKLWGRDVVHLLMVDENLRRQAFEYPDVLQGIIRSQARLRIPIQAPYDKVVEVWILVSNHVVQWFAIWLPQLAPRILEHYRFQLLRGVFLLREELRLSL